MPSRSSRSVVPVALLAALLVVGLNTWFAVAAVHALVDSETWLTHTWEVIGQEERMLQTITSAESSARGFALSGKESFLASYNVAQQRLPADTQSFRTLTADNPVQQANIDQFASVVSSRMRLLQTAIDMRRNAGLAAASALVGTGTGAEEMEHARLLLAAMESEERRLLVNRSAEARRDGVRTQFAIGLACVLDLLMIGSVTWYFWLERSLRLATELSNERLAIARAQAEKSAYEVALLNEELEDRVRRRTAELETTNRELEAFSYSVSHDLRAPLRTIDGFSLALMEDYANAVDETGRDYIARVRAGVQRMGQLIDALLQLSRITRAEITRETVQPSTIAENVATALHEENPGRDIKFTITPGPPSDADPKLVQVALENLLGNAVKFTARREHAEISFGWDPEQQAWRVQDNGAGFDMHYADKLFNAFNRLHGDRDFKGSGIGLATVARVIRRHHGRIWADAKVDHGATFWFTLG